MSLEEIFSELQAERPETPQRTHLPNGLPIVPFGPGYWDRVLAAGHKPWDAFCQPGPKPEKVSPVHTIPLSEYEIWWIIYRLRQDQYCTRGLEWLELQEVIQCLMKKLSMVSTLLHLKGERSNTLVEESSKPSSTECCQSPQTPIQDLHPSDATSVETGPSGTMTEP